VANDNEMQEWLSVCESASHNRRGNAGLLRSGSPFSVKAGLEAMVAFRCLKKKVSCSSADR